MNIWKALFNLCWLKGHDHEQIVDCDARRSFNRCTRCGHEHQYDFQATLSPNWIGFCDPPHRCPLCLGWKPPDWDRCANEICSMNPNGPIKLRSDGTVGYDLDTRQSPQG